MSLTRIRDEIVRLTVPFILISEDCYFQHPNEEGEYVWDQPGSFPAAPEVTVPRTTSNAQAISWAERGAAHVQELTKVMDVKLATLQRDLQKKQRADIEEYTLRAIERVVHPLEATVKRHTGQIDQLEASAKRQAGQIDQIIKDDTKIVKKFKKVDTNNLMKALDSLEKMGTFDPQTAWKRSTEAIAAVKSIDDRTDPGKWKDVQIQRLWKRLDEADEGRGKSILWQLARLQDKVDKLQEADAAPADLPVDLDSHGTSPSADEQWKMSETLHSSSSGEASSSAKQATNTRSAQGPSPDARPSPRASPAQKRKEKKGPQIVSPSPGQEESLKIVSQSPQLVLTLGRNAAPPRVYPATEAIAAQKLASDATVDSGAGDQISAGSAHSNETTSATVQTSPVLASTVTQPAEEDIISAQAERALVSNAKAPLDPKSIPTGPLQPTAGQMQAVIAQRERIDAILKQSQATLAANRASKALEEAKLKEQEAAATAKHAVQHGRSSKRVQAKAKQIAKQKQQAAQASKTATKHSLVETDSSVQAPAEAGPSASSRPGSSASGQEAAPLSSTASPTGPESAKSSPKDDAAVDAKAAAPTTQPKASPAKTAKHKKLLEARERNRVKQKAASARAAEERKAKALAKAAKSESNKAKEAAATDPTSKEEAKSGQPSARSSDTAKLVTEGSGPKSASKVSQLAATSKSPTAVEVTTSST